MKSLVLALLAASALMLPLASFSQTANNSAARAQVRSDLIQAEQRGRCRRRRRSIRRVRIAAMQARRVAFVRMPAR
jgi:Ni/Co efflux regulator RcnB